MDLSTPIKDAGLAFRLKSSALQRLDINTLEDLLYHLPFRYEDFTNRVSISKLTIDQSAVIRATVIDIKNEYTKKRFVIQKATVKDETGTIICTWFNQPYITRVILPGDEIGIAGKLGFFGKKPTFQVKEYEVLSKTNGIHTSGLVPIYSETRGISSKWLRNRIFEVLSKNKEHIEEFLPESSLEKLVIPNLFEAINNCHFPSSLAEAKLAHDRLAFNELLLAQIAALKRRDEWNTKNKGIPFKIKEFERNIHKFIDSLPFELTNDQKRAVEDIKSDLGKEIPMNRLLEGDVGSGKTVVAAIAMYVAYLNGYQSVIMAPTEILAHQHFETVKNIFEPLNITVRLKTGSSKPEANKQTLTNILVGTHALIQKNVSFDKLGLVVIDEQQRFGVKQRSMLREKGKNPHFLTMTATPIPRTVLFALYKDLDASYLKELPKGRVNIKTWLVPPPKRQSAYAWIKKQIVESDFKNQAFIVCPFIEESESMNTVKAAKNEFEKLSKKEFLELKLGLLHGKLKAKEKNEILTQFKDNKIDILVSTPVVEVGIDIPNATIMVIEAADRFGLSQLHQLRGRVGRSTKQSYCLLFSESQNETSMTRLHYMETAKSGFELAELDLRLRGPGDMFGTRQHGIAGFKIADFSDFSLVERAKKEAEILVQQLDSFPKLKKMTMRVSTKLVAPD